ncbi:methyltransferase type 11 [candidate division KSB1 bacterium 4484_87]|nr:MAG: methyltransferase type 11 [candidate division KSB1 bacterium 4484_87]
MEEKVCPVWVGYILLSPGRKWFENPKKLLSPYISEGMTALDVGSAMGFFSLPMAKMVGKSGKVICVDVQEKMVQKLAKRARRAGLSDVIETRVCPYNTLGLDDLKEKVDFVLAYAVVHEMPDAANFFAEIFDVLKSGGKVFFAEPKGHVSNEDFEATLAIAEEKGFSIVKKWEIRKSQVALLQK